MEEQRRFDERHRHPAEVGSSGVGVPDVKERAPKPGLPHLGVVPGVRADCGRHWRVEVSGDDERTDEFRRQVSDDLRQLRRVARPVRPLDRVWTARRSKLTGPRNRTGNTQGGAASPSGCSATDHGACAGPTMCFGLSANGCIDVQVMAGASGNGLPASSKTATSGCSVSNLGRFAAVFSKQFQDTSLTRSPRPVVLAVPAAAGSHQVGSRAASGLQLLLVSESFPCVRDVELTPVREVRVVLMLAALEVRGLAWRDEDLRGSLAARTPWPPAPKPSTPTGSGSRASGVRRRSRERPRRCAAPRGPVILPAR